LWFIKKFFSIAVARFESADYDLIMVHEDSAARNFSSCILGILEQSVSGTMDRERWTNSMAYSLL
jgi:hypothetical protein